MPNENGMIVLMGSGELTSTMVEVYKDLLAGKQHTAKAAFLDTPAGFQLNVHQLSQRAVEYFERRVQHPLTVASFRSSQNTPPIETEQACLTLREADLILIGPGSPTYAVRQWQQSAIPNILVRQIQRGGALVAASAAALTVGRFTLPVYEIYKVGSELFWEEGMNLLAHFGLNLVVIPHWNNAEGGTHDTRFCYMGEPRFQALAGMLPDDLSILGLDEHTACLIDLAREEVEIRGLGQVTLRSGKDELVFAKGDRFALEVLRGETSGHVKRPARSTAPSFEASNSDGPPSFWNRIHAIEASFHDGLAGNDPQRTANALLTLDQTIWQAQEEKESDQFVVQARDLLRELIVLLGTRLDPKLTSAQACLSPLVHELLALRDRFRQNQQYDEADAIRECLQRARVVVEDTREGTRWHVQGEGA